ncbi:DUF6318 family protein [Kineococcus sp. DHX-1]|uniref:DUF6318 family protein n=1 Tax=Kineococcus sp. DHX-1 TaxID=3349638 RepID=UPI0036D2C5BD
MIPARPLVATAVGLTLVGLLAGCSQEAPAAPAPAAAATSTATSTSGETHHEHDGAQATVTSELRGGSTPSSATPGIATPALDERAKVQDETGASLFAAYFLRVLNHARATADSSTLRSISVESCTGCRFYADVIDEYREKGYTTPQFVLQFTGTSIDAWDPASDYAKLTVTVDRPAYSTFDRNGSMISSDEAAPNSEFWMEVAWQQGHWMALEVE